MATLMFLFCLAVVLFQGWYALNWGRLNRAAKSRADAAAKVARRHIDPRRRVYVLANARTVKEQVVAEMRHKFVYGVGLVDEPVYKMVERKVPALTITVVDRGILDTAAEQVRGMVGRLRARRARQAQKQGQGQGQSQVRR